MTSDTGQHPIHREMYLDALTEIAELRDHLKLAESYAKGFENVRLDLVNERSELGRRLALAEEARERSLGDVRHLLSKLDLAHAVVEAADELFGHLIGKELGLDWSCHNRIVDALAAYRAEVKP